MPWGRSRGQSMAMDERMSFLLWSRNDKHMQKRSGFHQPVIYSTAFTPWIHPFMLVLWGSLCCTASSPEQ